MIAFTLATVVVVVVAPIFGYKVDLLISQINGLTSGDRSSLLTSASDPVYTGGYEATGSGYGAASGYAIPVDTAYAGAARSLKAGSAWTWTGILNRL